jgi:hypothetical protein
MLKKSNPSEEELHQKAKIEAAPLPPEIETA